VPILTVGDVMESDGWRVERQQNPDCLHLTVMPQHANKRQDFVIAVKKAIEVVKAKPELSKKGTAAIYGMVASVPSTELIHDFLARFIGRVFTQEKPK